MHGPLKTFANSKMYFEEQNFRKNDLTDNKSARPLLSDRKPLPWAYQSAISARNKRLRQRQKVRGRRIANTEEAPEEHLPGWGAGKETIIIKSGLAVGESGL